MNKWLLPSTDNNFLVNIFIEHGVIYNIIYNNSGEFVSLDIKN